MNKQIEIVPIEQIPSIVENTPCDKLSELYSIGQKMENVCLKNNGVGLSAVQVGIPWKFFVYQDQKNNKFNYMIDCEYFPVNEDKHLSIEGCLSIKSHSGKIRHFKVMRFKEIKVVGKILSDKDKLEVLDFEKVFKQDLECCIFQHEIDHHNNILISNIGQEIQIQEKISK
jgi:peptide deformylase